MKVNILAFGIAKEIMNGNHLVLETADGIKAAELKILLEEKYPGLQQLHSFMLAINNKYSNGTEIITTADEIAVIPPVSGG